MLELSKKSNKELIGIIETRGGETLLEAYINSGDGIFSRIEDMIKNRTWKKSRSISILYGDNKNRMKEVFGKQHFCYTTWYKCWYWFFEMDGLLFSVGCSIRGTDNRFYNLNGLPEREVKRIVGNYIEDLLKIITRRVA